MESRNVLVRLLVLVLAAALTFAACGGDDDDAGDDATATTAAADDAAEEPAGGGEPVSLAVSAVDNSFEPSSLSAPAGAEVTIEVTNDGSNPHTLTIDDPAADSGTLNGGDSGSVTFTMADGSLEFYCKIHGAGVMSGTIEAE